MTTSVGSSRNDASARYASRQRRAKQDIAPLPPPPSGRWADARDECDGSLRRFLELAFPLAFPLAWSDDHLRLIDETERAANVGQLKSLAMPRGSGKTTILARSALWALLTGRRRFCVIVAATEDAAKAILKGTIKTELLGNERLARIYPQEVYALRSLQGESRLADGQRFDGRLTAVEWKHNRINFGWIDGLANAGSALGTVGLTGNIRGQNYTTLRGEVMRVDLGLVDDPQTKDSARSADQSQTRHEIMMGDVLGMAGPTTKIAALCSGTVIYDGDLVDRLLDHKLSPQWNGDKCAMVYSWPDDEKLWDQYRAVMESEALAGGDGQAAADFVRANYAELHQGAVVGWKQRKDPGEVSALQHAYNLRFRDEPTFFAEYQNAPLMSVIETPFEINADDLLDRTNGVERGGIPAGVAKLTAFVDVQQRILYWLIAGWETNGRGHIIDYGTWPDQRRLSFTKRHINRTLQAEAGTEVVNDAIYIGLETLVGELMERKFARGTDRRGELLLQVDRVGIDARWGYSTEVVRRFARESKYAGFVHPTMGHFIGANTRAWQQWTHNKTDALGVHCKLRAPPRGIRGVAELLVDSNWWRSYVAERLVSTKGSDKSIQLFDAGPGVHRMIADHLASETPRLVTGKTGVRTIEWDQGRSDAENDYWDCLVGATVLSSLSGIAVDVETHQQKPATRRRRR